MLGKIRGMFNKSNSPTRQAVATASDGDAVSPVRQLPTTSPWVVVAAADVARAVVSERKRREQQFVDELAQQSEDIVNKLLQLVDTIEKDAARSAEGPNTLKDNSVVLVREKDRVTIPALDDGIRKELVKRNIPGKILIVQRSGKTVLQFWPGNGPMEQSIDR